MRIRLGHSPDPDDAFMFYGLATGQVDAGCFQIEHVLRNIQTLNEWALRGELEVTALSVHAYAHARGHYVLTRCGGSFGMDYGPMIVARQAFNAVELPYKTIAVPGTMTTAYLVLRLICKEPKIRVMPFDRIIQAVRDGQADAGLIIHEGQLTYEQAGLECVLDLGRWWQQATHLPLPLGANAVRRDLGPEVCRQPRQRHPGQHPIQPGPPRRGRPARPEVRPRHGGRAGRPVRGHVRQRPDAGHGLRRTTRHRDAAGHGLPHRHHPQRPAAGFRMKYPPLP